MTYFSNHTVWVLGNLHPYISLFNILYILVCKHKFDSTYVINLSLIKEFAIISHSIWLMFVLWIFKLDGKFTMQNCLLDLVRDWMDSQIRIVCMEDVRWSLGRSGQLPSGWGRRLTLDFLAVNILCGDSKKNH